MSANNGWSWELEVRFWAWVQILAMDHDATLDKAIGMSRRLQNTAWMMWACWVSSKRKQGVFTKRGHRQTHSRVKSGTLIVSHENSTRHHRTWHFYKYTWLQLLDGEEMGAFCIPPSLLTYLAQSFPSPWLSITWWFVCRERLLTLILLPLKFFILVGVYLMLCLVPTFPQSFSFVCTVTLKTECS